MMPIVHGLEKQYKGKLDVLYFDTSDKKYAAVKDKLKFEVTPQFILLRKNGERVREWTGIVPEAELEAAIDALLKE